MHKTDEETTKLNYQAYHTPGMMYYVHAALLEHSYLFVHAEAVGEELFVDPSAVARALELALDAPLTHA